MWKSSLSYARNHGCSRKYSPVQPKADQLSAEAQTVYAVSNSGGDGVFYVYVLRSLRNDKRYVGYSGKAPMEKLAEHNGGATRWTRNNRPLKLIHYEEFGDAKCAREREKFLKSGRGRQWLNENVKD